MQSVHRGRIYIRRNDKFEDLITGWTTKDAEVESVFVDGNKDYAPDVWYPNDIEVIITYHTFPAKDENGNETDNKEGQKLQNNLLLNHQRKAIKKLKTKY